MVVKRADGIPKSETTVRQSVPQPLASSTTTESHRSKVHRHSSQSVQSADSAGSLSLTHLNPVPHQIRALEEVAVDRIILPGEWERNFDPVLILVALVQDSICWKDFNLILEKSGNLLRRPALQAMLNQTLWSTVTQMLPEALSTQFQKVFELTAGEKPKRKP